MKTANKFLISFLVLSMGIVNSSITKAQDTDVCGVTGGSGYFYSYMDSDGDGIGEGEPIESCTDLSLNFCGALSFTMGNYPEEVSYTILDENGYFVESGYTDGNPELCLPFGNYTLQMLDSNGDGWGGNILMYNGNSYTLDQALSFLEVPFMVSNSEENTNMYVSLDVNSGMYGCTESSAFNYDYMATEDDGSCEFDSSILGCTESSAFNYDYMATEDDGSCTFDSSILGCTDSEASNYDAMATEDDGSCTFDSSILGCKDSEASNYDTMATEDDGSCEFDSSILGCTDFNASNYNPLATEEENSLCVFDADFGCMEDWADNYNANATAQLPDEIQNDTILFNDVLIASSSEASFYVNEYTNVLQIYGYSSYTDGDQIRSCIEGEDPYDCFSAYQQTQSQSGASMDTSLMNYPQDIVSCFQYNDSYSCENAVAYYPLEVSEYLNTLDVDSTLVEYCLQGDGESCISAISDLNDYATEVQNCFQYGYDCEIAVSDYSSQMAAYFDYDSTFVPTVSVLVNITQDGTYSFFISTMGNYDTQNTFDRNFENQGFYVLNSDTTFFSLLEEFYSDTISASAGAILTFGMSGHQMGEMSVESFIRSINLGSPTCFKAGCMLDWADNYNQFVTLDDGSCSKSGCMADWSDNFDPHATTDDGTCSRLGCMEDWADNYDALATIDNASCFIFGCMQEWADNYDASATTDITGEINLSNMNTAVYPSTSDGSVEIATNSFIINGINEGNGLTQGSSQSLTIPILNSGTYSFNWQHTDYDTDGAFYAVNFEPSTLVNYYNNTEITVLASNGTGTYQTGFNAYSNTEVWNGSVTVYLSAGDRITFGVLGEDLCCGNGVLSVENFTLLETENGSCFKNGCTVSSSCNYDATATIDDGSCGTSLTLTSNQSDYYCADFNWSLYTDNAELIEDGNCSESLEVCLSEGDYVLNANNSSDSEWWPSWTYVQINEIDSASTYNDSGTFDQNEVTINFTVNFGCTDTGAKNYSASATVADGSCFYGSCTDSEACNYDSTATEDDGTCTYVTNECQSCEFVHNHFELMQNDDDLDGICNDDDIPGCTNPLACNYDPTATDDDNSCITTNHCSDCLLASSGWAIDNDSDGDGICNDQEVAGCTDSEACNFQSSATDDDQSCTYNLAGYDCDGVCEVGLPITFGGGSWITEASFDIIDCDNNSLVSSSGVALQTCVDLPDNYTIYMFDTYGDGWTDNQLTVGDSVYGLPIGNSDTLDYGCFVNGCINVLACNFDESSTVDDGSCTFPETGLDCSGDCLDSNTNEVCDSSEVAGCLNELACNFAETLEEATLNDENLCEYPEGALNCEGNCEDGDVYTLEMVDSYGDGWNGTSILINNNSYTLENGSEASVSLCLDSATCNSISFTTGLYLTEVSWSIKDEDNAYVIDALDQTLNNQGVYFSSSLGAQYEGMVYTSYFGACDLIQGCTNETAFNYNANATEDDGTCQSAINGCTDDQADNYNELATTSDSSCNYTGCTIQFSTNYNSLANIEDGSCIIAVLGCMDAQADNFNPLANTSDEACSYSGECQYDQLVVSMYDTYGDGWNGNSLSIGAHSVTLEHDSETFTTFYGSDTVCVDLSYCNTVTVNGGTWQNEISWSIENLSYDVLLYGDAPFTDTLGACDNGIVGCSDMVASNYDANATSDGECIYTSNWDDSEVLGCDDASATNYNPGAQAFSAASCIYYGCTNIFASNYSSIATVDDGSCLSGNCSIGFVEDCDGSGECHPEDWLGDGELDCADQQFGADLSCHNNDGGDCGPIDEFVLGCTNPLASNYNPLATLDDNSCDGDVPGCMNEAACNYTQTATVDDNSCVFAPEGMNCDDLSAYEITQFGLLSNTDYLLKEGLCGLESYILAANDFYVAGVDYGEIIAQDEMYFSFEHVSSTTEQSPILFGDTVYLKTNELYLSSNTNLVSLNTDLTKAIKIVISPKIEAYLQIQLTNFDKFNIVGLFGDSETPKYLAKGTSNDLYYWSDDYNFGSFRASNYLDYSEVTCGCTNPIALNYNALATENDNSCAIEGCMDPYNDLFNPIANISGSCDVIVPGCIYDWAYNYNVNANQDDNSCVTIIYGCVDANYFDNDTTANTNDGSCEDLIVPGCTDSTFIEYWIYYPGNMSINLPNQVANIENNSCSTPIQLGCTNTNYIDFNENTNVKDDSLCITLKSYGCIDSSYLEFDALANTENGTCEIPRVYGCTDTLYLDFDSLANYNEGHCLTLIVVGCMDDDFTEYSSINSVSDTSTCITPVVFGCTDEMFVEFSALANTDNGTCSTYLVVGCGNPSALNYVLGVTNNDNSLCVFEETEGCTDDDAFNYDALADLEDGTCIDVVLGCMYLDAFNYDSNANTDDGSCVLVYTGCLDSTMFNYDPEVNTDDGSCYPIVLGCMDSTMFNYDLIANTYNNSCVPFVEGCLLAEMFNYDEEANTSDNSCIPKVFGCMDTLYVEYNAQANTDNATCTTLVVEGCTDSLYLEYDELSNTNDGSCVVLKINGCTDNLYVEFDATANFDNGSCDVLIILGCTDDSMLNFDENANTEDGSCYMLVEGCMDPAYLEYNSLANFDNQTCSELAVEGCMDSNYIEYNSEANLDDDSCIDTIFFGCLDNLYVEYNPQANSSDSSCEVPVVLGCTDPTMYNYYEFANTDNGTCFSLSDFTLNPQDYQFNMSITAQIEYSQGLFSTNTNDSIILISSVTGQVSGFANMELVPFGVNTYYAFITAYSNHLSDELIVYVTSSYLEGNSAIVDTLNFIPNSMLGSISSPWVFSLDNSSENFGCTNSNASNYNSDALINDGSCIILGCSNPSFIEYSAEVTHDNGSCSSSWQSAYDSQLIELNTINNSLLEANSTISNLEDSLVNTLSNANENLILIDNLQVQILNLESSGGTESSLVDYFIHLPEGWSFFGYNCFDSIDLSLAFEEVAEKVIIIKDQNGEVYLPEFNFNSIGDLFYAEGYQIKTYEEITEFQFCKVLISEE